MCLDGSSSSLTVYESLTKTHRTVRDWQDRVVIASIDGPTCPVRLYKAYAHAMRASDATVEGSNRSAVQGYSFLTRRGGLEPGVSPSAVSTSVVRGNLESMRGVVDSASGTACT